MGAAAGALPSLTVGVPTFNRRDSVLRLARPLAEAAAAGRLALLVVDDGSEDGTAEALAGLAGPGVEVVERRPNAGYARAVVTLLERAGSEYLLLAADDDLVDVAALPRLQAWLGETRPDLVRSVHVMFDVVGMGPVHPTAPLRPTEFRDAASHAPGLVLRVDAARAAAPFLAAQIDAGNVAATTYPQAVVAAWVLACGTGWWWNDSVVREAEALPSGLRDSAGRPYWAPGARLDQGIAYLALLADLEAAVPAGGPREAVRSLRSRHLRTLYPALRAAVAEQDAAAARWPLDRATLRQVAAGWLRRLGRG